MHTRRGQGDLEGMMCPPARPGEQPSCGVKREMKAGRGIGNDAAGKGGDIENCETEFDLHVETIGDVSYVFKK